MKLTPLLKSNYLTIDIETTSESGTKEDNTNPWKNEIICIALRNELGNSVVLTLDEMFEEKDLLKKVIESEKIKKIAANGKFDFKTLAVKGFGKVKNFYFDTQMAGIVLDSRGAKELKDFSVLQLCKKYIDPDIDFKMDYKEEHTVEEWCEQCLLDVEHEEYLAKVLHSKLVSEDLLDVFTLEMSVLEKVIDIELRGIPIDREGAEKLAVKYKKNFERVSGRLHRFLKRNGVDELVINKVNKKGEDTTRIVPFEKINLNSSDQLKVLLYDVFNCTKKTKYDSKTRKRKLTTDKKALSELAYEEFEIARWILFYRYWTKLVEYSQKMVDLIQEDGRIHCTFNSYGTETGRFSSKNPNMQQIPAKTHEAVAIRKAIVGDLIVADYSNMELRIMAAVTEDKSMLDVYSSGDGDLHTDTAKKIFNTDKPTKAQRNKAKTVNFGVSYGAQGRALAEQINMHPTKPWIVIKDRVSEEEAEDMRSKWFESRPGVKEWQDKVVAIAETVGYSQGLYGHRRYIDYEDLHRGYKKDEFKLAGLDRQAINHVIQNTSAAIMKLAIYALRDENIVIQVHDEIVIENPKRSKEEIKEIMENVVNIGVKTTVDIDEVKCWADAKG